MSRADWLDEAPPSDLDPAPRTERMSPTRYAFVHHEHPAAPASEVRPVPQCRKTDPCPASEPSGEIDIGDRVAILPPAPREEE